MSDAELADVARKKNDDSVDLYDAAESGGSISRLNKSSIGARSSTSQSDNLVLSKRADLSSKAYDPLEFALNEIADTTKTTLQAPSSDALAPNRQQQSSSGDSIARQSNVRNADTKVRTNLHDSGSSIALTASARAVTQDVSSQESAEERAASTPKVRRATPNELEPRQDPFGDWYKQVPIWFWTVAIGGYAVAIFLAGVLFSLLFSLKN